MINKTLNIKLIIFSIGLFLSMFSFSDKASALTYVFDCVGGGQITTNASITPTGPFNSGSPTSFTATVSSVSSNCQSLPVTVTAQNNNGSVITMVNQTLNPGVPIGPFDQNFTSPSSSGTYAVHFITGADEPAPDNILLANTSLGVLIDNITFNGVSVNPFPDYNSSREFYESLDPSVDVYIEWTNEFNGYPGETVIVTDSYGATQCKMIEKGDPNPFWTFSGVDTTGPGSYMITVEASNNPYCP